MECLCTSLGLNTVIDVSDRTDEPVIIRSVEWKRNYPLYCLRWYGESNKRCMGNIFVVRNNGMYFRVNKVEKLDDIPYETVYCFEVKDEREPYFTLPNGMITHNCRLRNELQDNTFSYTLGAGGVATGSKCVMTIKDQMSEIILRGYIYSELNKVDSVHVGMVYHAYTERKDISCQESDKLIGGWFTIPEMKEARCNGHMESWSAVCFDELLDKESEE